jgi:hypothetical protein
MSKPPTPQGISRLLAKAAFERAEETPYRVMGVRQYTGGFHVVTDHQGSAVRVTWWPPSHSADDALAKNAEMLLAYGDELAEAGWTVTVKPHKVVVTAGEGTR